jgi:DNA repair protein RecO (recombination protein O)
MHPKTYKSEGIVLGRQNYGEADRIIHIFSKDYGKVALIAKGVRKLTSRKRGHIEIFMKLNFSGIKGKGLDIISEAEQLESYVDIRKNLKKVSLAYYFTEVVGRLMHEGDVNKDVYIILSTYLNKLKDLSASKKLRLEFLKEIIITTGYWPEGKTLQDPDIFLEEIIQKKPYTLRVGKRVLL